MFDKQEFITYLESSGLGKKTIDLYLIYYNLLNIDRLGNEKNQYIYEYIKTYNNGISRSMLKKLFEFIKNRADLPEDLNELAYTFNIPKFTGSKKKKEIEVLTLDQVLQLADSMSSRRLSLMVLTTFYLGLRLNELLTLRVNDIIWSRKQARIRWEIAKRKRERILPVPDWLINELVDFIDKQSEANPEYAKKGIIFNMGKVRWERFVKRRSQKLGLGIKVTPHILRHSCGSYLRTKGLDITEIKEFLGHSSIETTQRYIHLNKDNLNEKVLNALQV